MRTQTAGFVIVVLMGCFSAGFSQAQDQNGNYFGNGGFEDGVLEPWGTFGNTAVEVVSTLAGAAVPEEPIEGDFCLHVTVLPGAANWWNVGLQSSGAVFESGKKYTVSVFMKCKEDTFQVDIKPQQAADPWPGFGQQTFTITEEWAEYSVTTPVFTEDTSPPAVTFHTGFGTGEFWIDGARFYEGDYVPPVLPKKVKARKPIPAEDAEDVQRDAALHWVPGVYAASHNVFIGTSWEDVNNASLADPLGTEVAEALDVNSFDPARFDFDTVYYWRVDEVNGTPDAAVFKGSVWQFTAEPYSIQVPASDMTVTASSTGNTFSTPQKVIDGSGLAPDGTHNIDDDNMWFSAAVDLDPWIQFEFDDIRQLDTMTVWNSNSAAEIALGWGVKDVSIEYSIDGEDWDVLADVNQFGRAPGLPTYNQYDEIVFGGVPAKFVRLDIASNWGGLLMSYSLSEVQFNEIPVRARTPVPASGSVDVLPTASVAWRAGRTAGTHTVYMSADIDAVADGTAPSASSGTNSLDLSVFDLHMGETYYWRVDEVNEAASGTVWTGPVWQLSLATSLVVEDFEGYTNFSPDRPFQTWLDGFGYSADEFFPEAYAGNGTGAGVGHDIWSISSPYFQGDIMEGDITLSGSSQSMPFYYGNVGSTASQAERSWAAPQNWSAGGAQALVLHVFGAADNTGQLYVKINGTKIPYDGDAANLTRLRWTAWPIDLTSLNVSSVTSFSIGVDGPGASGMFLLDDMILYGSAPDQLIPEAPGTDGLVAHWAMDEGAGAMVGDSAGSNPGTIQGGVTWRAGHTGSALDLDGGLTSYVNCGASAVFDLEEAVTLSAWVNASASTEFFRPIVGKGDHAYMLRHGSGETFDFFIHSNGAWHQISATAPDALYLDSWVHVVGTFDGSDIKLYINGVLAASEAYSGTMSLAEHDVNIGRNSEVIDRVYEGGIDDVRIYGRGLTDAEVLYLSNH